MRLGELTLDCPVFIAPMAGVTDRAFREICFERGGDAAVTEMISAKALYYGNRGTETLLRAVDDRPGRIAPSFQFPGDGAGRGTDTVIRQFSVPKKQERPVQGRLLGGRIRPRNACRLRRSFDGEGDFHRAWASLSVTSCKT